MFDLITTNDVSFPDKTQPQAASFGLSHATYTSFFIKFTDHKGERLDNELPSQPEDKIVIKDKLVR